CRGNGCQENSDQRQQDSYACPSHDPLLRGHSVENRDLALISAIDPKQTSPLRMRSTEVAAWPEGNNLVAGVMPNVGASQPCNPGLLTPVTGNFFFVHSEIGFVRGDGAATTKHDARHPSDFGVAGNVKKRPINPVHCLSYLFQHEHMPVELRL